MAVLASSMNSGLHYAFPDKQIPRLNGRAAAAGLAMNVHVHHTQQHQFRQFRSEDEPEIEVDDPIQSLFCRALYDYESQDNSALSFRRGDIIEILSQQPSGWWDGLLGDERGWFPSNYVVIISEEEAEQVFAAANEIASQSPGTLSPAGTGAIHRHQNGTLGAAMSAGAEAMPTVNQFGRIQAQLQTQRLQHVDTDTEVDLSHALMRGGMGHLDGEQWIDGSEGRYGRTNGHIGSSVSLSSQSSDFWMPQVTPDNQVRTIDQYMCIEFLIFSNIRFIISTPILDNSREICLLRERKKEPIANLDALRHRPVHDLILVLGFHIEMVVHRLAATKTWQGLIFSIGQEPRSLGSGV